ncbi:NAD(P)H-binding protein [Saccharopolyspora shandongensis]
MDVFIIGITGGIGGLLAQKLRSRGDAVHGLVRRDDQQAELATRGMNARVGDLSSMTVEDLAATFGDVDVIVFSAGSNGGSKEVTKAIDGDGVAKAIKAARLAGVERGTCRNGQRPHRSANRPVPRRPPDSGTTPTPRHPPGSSPDFTTAVGIPARRGCC